MKIYEVKVTLTVQADSEEDAAQVALEEMDYLCGLDDCRALSAAIHDDSAVLVEEIEEKA